MITPSPPPPPDRPSVITSPDWLRVPYGDDFERYYPPSAMAAGIEGRAALKLAGLHRMKPISGTGKLVAGGRVTLPAFWLR